VRECESTARCTTENAVLLLTNFSNAWEVRKRSKATTQDRRRRRKRHRVKRPHQHRACVRWCRRSRYLSSESWAEVEGRCCFWRCLMISSRIFVLLSGFGDQTILPLVDLL
jgi:hypothetical protein